MTYAILLAVVLQGDGPYVAPHRGPTPDETLILELMNRFRSDPSAECDLILKAVRERRGPRVDWKMFEKEMKALKPAPPLVFNLELLDAARKHSWYMIRNGLGHDETPGRPGFTGASPGDRIRRAGYAGRGAAENAFASSGGAWPSHWGFIVDAGAGPGGMQPGRGHRRNMMGAGYRDVGPGGVPHPNGKRLSVTHNFGRRDARSAGGVTYIDLNGNSFYDVGEGVGGVAIRTADGRSTLTWSSGAYTLDLKGRGATTLVAELGGERITRAVPAGQENVKFDWIVPVEIPLRKADRLLAAFEKAGDPGSAAYLRAQVDLYEGTRGLYLDDARRKRVEERVAGTGAQLERDRAEVLRAITEPPSAGLQALLSRHRKTYRGTAAADWFEDAEVEAKLRRGVAQFRAGAKAKKPTQGQRRRLAALIGATAERLRTPLFRGRVEALMAEVNE